MHASPPCLGSARTGTSHARSRERRSFRDRRGVEVERACLGFWDFGVKIRGSIDSISAPDLELSRGRLARPIVKHMYTVY